MGRKKTENEECDFFELGKTYGVFYRDDYEIKAMMIEQSFGKRKAELFKVGFSSVIEENIDALKFSELPLEIKTGSYGDNYIAQELEMFGPQTIEDFISDFRNRLEHSSLSLEAIESMVNLLDEFELYEAGEIYEVDSEGTMPMEKRVEFEMIFRGHESNEEQELAISEGAYTPKRGSML